MDDTEDDARYPPDPYSALHRHRSSAIRSRPIGRSAPSPHQIPRRYPHHEEVDSEEGDEENDEEDEPVGAGLAAEDPEDEEDDEDDKMGGGGGGELSRYRGEESSPESRGKRRKLDKYALGFEFAPRVVASHPSASGSRPPVVRNSLVDWSEDSTFALLDSWGVLYVKNGRKSLKSEEWMEVAKKVNQASRIPRTDSQCRNRINTLKKKYKKEKAKLAEIKGYASTWVYFKKMDELMEAPLPPPPVAPRQLLRLPRGVDSGEFVFTDSSSRLNRPNGLDELMDSPAGSESMGDDEDDDSDGLPPPNVKRAGGGLDAASFKMLADSIEKFGEIYEKIENSKRQNMLELERMRRDFQRDLEFQKRQILERAQTELAKIRQESGDEDDGSEDGGHDNDGREANGSVDKTK